MKKWQFLILGVIIGLVIVGLVFLTIKYVGNNKASDEPANDTVTPTLLANATLTPSPEQSSLPSDVVNFSTVSGNWYPFKDAINYTFDNSSFAKGFSLDYNLIDGKGNNHITISMTNNDSISQDLTLTVDSATIKTKVENLSKIYITQINKNSGLKEFAFVNIAEGGGYPYIDFIRYDGSKLSEVDLSYNVAYTDLAGRIIMSAYNYTPYSDTFTPSAYSTINKNPAGGYSFNQTNVDKSMMIGKTVSYDMNKHGYMTIPDNGGTGAVNVIYGTFDENSFHDWENSGDWYGENSKYNILENLTGSGKYTILDIYNSTLYDSSDPAGLAYYVKFQDGRTGLLLPSYAG